MFRLYSIAALLALVAAPGAAQEITNKPVFLDEEGPALQRAYVRALGEATVRWEQRASYAINKDTNRPTAWTEVVVAQWDAEVCARRRGPFCAARGAWRPFKTLNARDGETGEVEIAGAASGHYLIFGRSRYDPSPRSSWGLDMVIADDTVEPGGARRLTFDTSTTVGGGVRYSVWVVPRSD